jgi:signal transduction histidine kinase
MVPGPRRPAAALAITALVALLAGGAPVAAGADAPSAAPAAESRPAAALQDVLMIDSFGRDFAPYDAIASSFRTVLAEISPRPIEFLEVSLETVRFEAPEDEPAADYIRSLCRKRRFDLVVLNGEPAARFWMRNRAALLPATPVLVCAVEERHLKGLNLPPGIAALPTRIDLSEQLRSIQRLLPDLRDLYVVVGDSPLERYWIEAIRRDWSPFEGQVRLHFTDDEPFQTTLKRMAALPPHSAIFFALLLVDAAGVPHAQMTAVDDLRRVANAPMFSWSDGLLGRGIVGGPLLPLTGIGREAARAAVRILEGERPETVPMPVLETGPPRYDARELRRFGIDERILPDNAVVLYRSPPLLSRYRWTIALSVGVVAAQAIAIAYLIVSRRRRIRAEEEATRLGRELALAGRVSIIGQLSSSLAHELNQPLGAILRNAEAAELFLEEPEADLKEIRAILEDIRKDTHRAGSVIDGIRALLRRQPLERTPIDVTDLVEGVFSLVRQDAQARGVVLNVESRDRARVLGTAVQLQQVLLNLVLNGMEAMDGTPFERRDLTVRVGTAEPGWVEIAVRDRGAGILPETLPRVFDNFFTTKVGGMGMGLAICRRLVEAHGGRIAAHNESDGGTTVRILLPAAGGSA